MIRERQVIHFLFQLANRINASSESISLRHHRGTERNWSSVCLRLSRLRMYGRHVFLRLEKFIQCFVSHFEQLDVSARDCPGDPSAFVHRRFNLFFQHVLFYGTSTKLRLHRRFFSSSFITPVIKRSTNSVFSNTMAYNCRISSARTPRSSSRSSPWRLFPRQSKRFSSFSVCWRLSSSIRAIVSSTFNSLCWSPPRSCSPSSPG